MRIIDAPSPNFNDRADGRSPDMLILHYTGMKSGQEALQRLQDPAAQVSAHYMVDEDGTIYAMVDESKRAYHAGVSSWEGQKDINSRSIGIEIVNPGHDWGYRAFPEVQMQAVVELCGDILSRHNIAPWHVLGHSDIAPKRKQDPGELFDWAFLAASGIGLWPRPEKTTEDLAVLLEAFGYGEPESVETLTAFQRHWQPEIFKAPELAGKANDKTAAIAAALCLEKKKSGPRV